MDEQYYIENLILPPLARVFDHIGADVKQWYKTMPKIRRVDAADATAGTSGDTALEEPMGKLGLGLIKYGIDSHFRKAGCVVCGRSVDERDGGE